MPNGFDLAFEIWMVFFGLVVSTILVAVGCVVYQFMVWEPWVWTDTLFRIHVVVFLISWFGIRTAIIASI